MPLDNLTTEMQTLAIIQIILEVLIILLGLYLAFFKSYFQEKGKNLATKEDIEEITRKVENIKNELLYSTQTKLSLKSEERISLVTCYEKYNYWLNTIVDAYFGGINEENKSKLKDLQDKIDEAKFQYEMAEGRMELFVNNEELTKLRVELKLKTLELQHEFERYSGQIEYVLFEISSMRTIIPIHLQPGEFKKLLEKKSSIIQVYNKEKLDKFKLISPLNGQFQVLIYNHLQKLIED